jgi:hypothetical protein
MDKPPYVQREGQHDTQTAPIGEVGLRERDAKGRWKPGNQARLLVGERSIAFWTSQEAVRREMVDAVLRDLGTTREDASVAVLACADSLAQACLVRDSAFLRLAENGGPLSASDRARRSFVVWAAAFDRALKAAITLGLERRPRKVPTIAEVLE